MVLRSRRIIIPMNNRHTQIIDKQRPRIRKDLSGGRFFFFLVCLTLIDLLLFFLGGSVCRVDRVDRVGAVDDVVLLLFLFDAGCRDISIHGE